MLLQVEGLCKTFGNTPVLNNIHFSLEKGEIVSLVGKSGAGKTTLLRCITGLEKCDSGTVSILDHFLCQYHGTEMKYADKKELREIRKNLGMVFQNYHLFPHKTVLQNVSMTLTDVYKLPKKEAEKKAVAMLESLDMGDKLSSKPFALSGGQKQRVAIARSCVTSPKLLCFDEPTAALDTALISDIIKIIHKLAEDGMGILIISHDENFVEKVSDRILMMKAGKIMAEVSAKEYGMARRE